MRGCVGRAGGVGTGMGVDPRILSDLFEHETLGAPEKAVGFVLWRVVHRYVREIDRVLAPVELTHLQFTVLALTAWMERSGDPVTQAAVARFGDVHPMQVSQVLKALEAKGMVERSRNAPDTRAKRLETTEAGVAALRRAMPLAIEVQQQFFRRAGSPEGGFLTDLLRIDAGTVE